MNNEELNEMLHELDNIPYPEVKYVVKNSNYANMLYDDMSGELGELSAVTQYVYEHMDLSDFNVISGIMIQIAIQEMKHLNFVGDLIKRLGKTPYFIGSKGSCWTTENVKYKFTNLVHMMEYNIETENAAIEGYSKAIYCTRNQDIRKLFQRIILDEKNHIKIFKKIIEMQKNV